MDQEKGELGQDSIRDWVGVQWDKVGVIIVATELPIIKDSLLDNLDPNPDN